MNWKKVIPTAEDKAFEEKQKLEDYHDQIRSLNVILGIENHIDETVRLEVQAYLEKALNALRERYSELEKEFGK